MTQRTFFIFFIEKILTNLEKFAELGISEKTLEALAKKGFEEPSPIQKQVIPLLLQENINVIGQAETGSGKTAAFGIPLVEKITTHSKDTQALILTPTRELAVQVAEEIRSFLSDRKIKVSTIYGGQSYTIQIKQLKEGADIVVGTPGRVIDHLNKGTLRLKKLKYLILDEADEMLNMGFIDDIKTVLSHANSDKSMLLFSATMPKEILQVAKKYMGEYQVVSIKKKQLTTTQTDQIYFEVQQRDKFEALCRIIDIEPDFYGIIFCRTKIDVESVSSALKLRGYEAEALHGDIQQRQREIILKRFKGKKMVALVATDVAARGIDVDDVTHVINYALPQDPESYVHRVGRTGRAGKKGTAITFVTPSEYNRLALFKRVTRTDIKQGKIPGVEEIVRAKKNKLKADLGKIIESSAYKGQVDMAQDLLTEWDPTRLISALLMLNYQNEFSEDKYRPISEVSIDKTGKSRLFIALGKNKGYTIEKLIDFVSEKSGVPSDLFQEVRVLEEFSFISLPFEDAEVVLHIFEKTRPRGGRSLVSKAKDKNSKSGSGDRRGSRNYGSDRNSRGSRDGERRSYGDRRSSNSRYGDRNSNNRSGDRRSDRGTRDSKPRSGSDRRR